MDLHLENAHLSDVTALKASSTYDNILISGAADGEIKIWDVVLGKPLKIIRNLSGWVFNILTFERPHFASFSSETSKLVIDSWKESIDPLSSPPRRVISSPKKK